MIKATRRTRLHVSAVALVAALTLAGCGDSPPDRAGTVGESSADTGESAPEESPETEQVELDTVGRELTNEEAKAALPPVSALPTGWSVDPENTLGDDSESEEESEAVIEPAQCQTIMDDLAKEQDQEPTGEASQTYTAGMLGPFVGVEINSFSDEVPEDSFKKFLDALTTCSEFTSTEGGQKMTYKVSSLSFPNLGEESAAIRMSGTAEQMAIGLDMVVIRAGHNLVSLSHATIGGATGSGDVLEKVARKTVTSMESK